MAETDPDALEREIERTRVELARTVDAIADRVSPKRVAERSVAKVKANAERLVGGAQHRHVRPGEEGEAGVWDEYAPRDISPVLIAMGVALVVGATVLLLRRRNRS
ncbi:DUF3618 domain-containing protein [Microtetraspora sp. AC03309]|uniref:DUF3618 domain-containing protein n=1 Tax=Microtetraspora sp. AC03309 TaxID=2779376 RepID=UPI001E360CC8|nr:DUF3618 domain-containing protein [Microtetraspora sp. AC03309]MCC5575079.1 DUF3618 domain-containing protein [Microtetraspora sp. AC03309]